MFDFNLVDEVLKIDPTYITIMAASVFGFIQALKGLGKWFEQYALILAIVFSGILSVLVIFGFEKIVASIILTQVIAAAGSGLYSWGKSKDETVVQFPDYSDEQ